MNSRGRLLLGICGFIVMIAGCGGGADDEPSTTTTAASTTVAGEVSTTAAPEGSPNGDDFAGTLLEKLFGLSSAILTDAERDCMNSELGTAFPRGLPDDPNLEEHGAALDEAAEVCDVTL